MLAVQVDQPGLQLADLIGGTATVGECPDQVDAARDWLLWPEGAVDTI